MPAAVIQLVAIVSTLESAGAGQDGLELTVTSAHLLMAAVSNVVLILFQWKSTFYYYFVTWISALSNEFSLFIHWEYRSVKLLFLYC